MENQRLILASSSPQRASLLSGLGWPFTVVPSTVQEASVEEGDPAKRAVLLARLKAQDVWRKETKAPEESDESKESKQVIVIGCDTLVVSADGTLLEKPEDEAQARMMLVKQSGRTSVVHSGLCVIDPTGKKHEGLSSSTVLFTKLTTAEIEWWMGTGLWKDRSGAFQIDGPGQLMIERVEGDWPGIVGLPVFLLGQLLKEAGWKN